MFGLSDLRVVGCKAPDHVPWGHYGNGPSAGRTNPRHSVALQTIARAVGVPDPRQSCLQLPSPLSLVTSVVSVLP